MPSQHLDPAFMLAIGIWLFALFVFALMLIAVIVALISENSSRQSYGLKKQITGKYSLRRRRNLPAKKGASSHPQQS